MIEPTVHKFLQRGFNDSIQLDDDSVPLIITNPPVPMSSTSDALWAEQDGRIERLMGSEHGMKAFEAIHKVLVHTWKEVHRVLTPGGVFAVFVDDVARTIGEDFRLYSNQSKIIGACSKLGFDLLPSISISCPNPKYTKYVGSGLLPVGAYVPVESQALLFFRKKGKREFYKKDKELRAQSAMLWEERNAWLGKTWQIEDKKEFYRRVIMMWSIYGDVIIDPFARDSSLSLATASAGRSSISYYLKKSKGSPSASFLTKRNTKQKLNEIIESRISDHWRYVQSKNMLYFRYKNGNHGFPVKSSQEKSLAVFLVKSISRSGDDAIIKYQKLRKERENAILVAAMNVAD